MPLDNAPLTPEGLTALYPALEAAFTDRRAVQKSDIRHDFATVGIGYQWIADRLNTVLGPAHWRLHDSDIQVFNQADSYRAVAKVALEIGNPHYVPDRAVNGWEVIAVRTAWGSHQAPDYGDALKGAVTNGFKKAAALFGPGHQAFAGLMDDDSPTTGDGWRGPGSALEATKPLLSDGWLAVRVASGQYVGGPANTGVFRGRLSPVATPDVLIPMVAHGIPATQLQTAWHAQHVVEVQGTDQGDQGVIITQVRPTPNNRGQASQEAAMTSDTATPSNASQNAPAVPKTAQTAQADHPSPQPSGTGSKTPGDKPPQSGDKPPKSGDKPPQTGEKPPVAITPKAVEEAEGKALKVGVQVARIRAHVVGQDPDPTPRAMEEYLQDLRMLTALATHTDAMMARVTTLEKYMALVPVATAVGRSEEHALEPLIQEAGDQNVASLSAEQYQHAAGLLIPKLLEGARRKTA